MEHYDNEEEKEVKEEQPEEQEETDDEGFMQGYEKDEDVDECAECGVAVSKEQQLKHEIEGEEYIFCSKTCADEFEETMKME